jgi:hypothetical protein
MRSQVAGDPSTDKILDIRQILLINSLSYFAVDELYLFRRLWKGQPRRRMSGLLYKPGKKLVA